MLQPYRLGQVQYEIPCAPDCPALHGPPQPHEYVLVWLDNDGLARPASMLPQGLAAPMIDFNAVSEYLAARFLGVALSWYRGTTPGGVLVDVDPSSVWRVSWTGAALPFGAKLSFASAAAGPPWTCAAAELAPASLRAPHSWIARTVAAAPADAQTLAVSFASELTVMTGGRRRC